MCSSSARTKKCAPLYNTILPVQFSTHKSSSTGRTSTVLSLSRWGKPHLGGLPRTGDREKQDKSERTASLTGLCLTLFSCSTDSLAQIFSIDEQLLLFREHSEQSRSGSNSHRKSTAGKQEVSTSRQSSTDKLTAHRFLLLINSNCSFPFLF